MEILDDMFGLSRMQKAVHEKVVRHPNGNLKIKYKYQSTLFDCLKQGEYREWDEDGLLIGHRFYYGIKLTYRPNLKIAMTVQSMTGPSTTQWIDSNPEQEKCNRLTLGIKMKILKYKDQLKKSVKIKRLATKQQIDQTQFHLMKNLITDYCFL